MHWIAQELSPATYVNVMRQYHPAGKVTGREYAEIARRVTAAEYEQALEDLGIPLSTQAGKGLFWRQEIQDLIAVTRVLSNRRDSLALGALLRGPLVGLSDEELLDIVAELPRDPESQEFAFLTIDTNPAGITHRVARETLITLRDLVRRAYNTTPFDILNAAVERLNVRPMLKLRHPQHPERALANVDLFLEFSRQYSVRGLRAFARDMMRRWKDAERQIEGRADAGADAVQIVTLHTAKGLEWPVVIPINMITKPRGAAGVLFDSRNHVLFCKYDPIRASAYDALQAEENEQLRRERVRMWYVCCTRARDLLVIPDHVNGNTGASWFGELDLRLAELPLVGSEEQGPYNRPKGKTVRPWIFSREKLTRLAGRHSIFVGLPLAWRMLTSGATH
jgi:exodeoxyribonuclease-5